jgi:Xaa-Pro dipeptidase
LAANVSHEREHKLLDAQAKAEQLFAIAQARGYVAAGQMEKDLNAKMYELALELFGIRKYWHKRIVRAGRNTLFPYRENPPNLPIASDDILFFDFGPVFEDWEADLGRTYVLGDDPIKHKLAADIRAGWDTGRAHFHATPDITGAELYAFSSELARSLGWEYGGPHCGHLIGNFPHEQIQGEEVENYIHPDNHKRMRDPDRHGGVRHWIYEIHFVDRAREIGGFFEQLLTI